MSEANLKYKRIILKVTGEIFAGAQKFGIDGQTVKAFFLDALQDKLAKVSNANGPKTGWRAVFGKAKKEDVDAVQQAIDEKFSLIHLEDWQCDS